MAIVNVLCITINIWILLLSNFIGNSMFQVLFGRLPVVESWGDSIIDLVDRAANTLWHFHYFIRVEFSKIRTSTQMLHFTSFYRMKSLTNSANKVDSFPMISIQISNWWIIEPFVVTFNSWSHEDFISNFIILIFVLVH